MVILLIFHDFCANEWSSVKNLFHKGNAISYLMRVRFKPDSLFMSEKTQMDKLTDGQMNRELAVYSFTRLLTAFAKQYRFYLLHASMYLATTLNFVCVSSNQRSEHHNSTPYAQIRSEECSQLVPKVKEYSLFNSSAGGFLRSPG